MNATEILKVKRPEDMFLDDVDATKRTFHDYAKKWHPDVCKDDKGVFMHIQALYKEAMDKINGGHWGFEGTLRMGQVGSKDYDKLFKYRTSKKFELGRIYIGDEAVAYMLTPSHQDLLNNFRLRASSFKFKSKRMEEDCSRYLPQELTYYSSDGRLVLFIKKSKNFLLLRDVMNHYGGSLDPKHTAWILSRLHNLACYLNWAELSHNEISPDTVFIDPANHVATLLGGWWYATPFGKKLEKVTKRTHGVIPWDVAITKKALPETDLELIRATGRELLGDIRGINPKESAPPVMWKWLSATSGGNAVQDYEEWGQVLIKSYGARKFHMMELTAEQLYNKGGP